MNLRKIFGGLFYVLASLPTGALGAGPPVLSPIEQLGKRLYLDTSLSTPTGMACSVCHGPTVGFTGPDQAVNKTGGVYPGVVPDRAGNRKPPASAYAGDSPTLRYDKVKGRWVGGMFWDGRATGWTLGDPLAEQALGPFLNPLEQNTPTARDIVVRVAQSSYAPLFLAVFGGGSLDTKDNASEAYARIGRAIAAYERSAEVSPFASKYDAYLAGRAALTPQETRGRQLFEGKARCASCHPNCPGPRGERPVFTDFSYDNLGIPKNPDNPFYRMPKEYNPDGKKWIDPGLGGFFKTKGYPASVYEPQMGRHKVPTLRNVAKRPNAKFIKAYGHNGYFKSLESVVHFYNTRDAAKWPPPEYPRNINRDEMGHLGLTAEDEAAIVAFLKTLSDVDPIPAR